MQNHYIPEASHWWSPAQKPDLFENKPTRTQQGHAHITNLQDHGGVAEVTGTCRQPPHGHLVGQLHRHIVLGIQTGTNDNIHTYLTRQTV